MSDGTDAESVPPGGDLARLQRADLGPAVGYTGWAAEDEEIRAWVAAQDGSTSDRLARLLGDVDVLTRLQSSDYADEDWLPAAEEFARYGVDVLRAWIGAGTIFERVRSRTSFVLASPPDGTLDEDAVHDLATDTVVVSLRMFRDDVLRKRRWDPRKGASLKTFFIGQCLFQFPNVYRAWLRERRRHLIAIPVDARGVFEAGLGSAAAAVMALR